MQEATDARHDDSSRLDDLARHDWPSRHEWVDARPFRMHCRRLLAETGLGIGELAAHAQVPARVLHRLVVPGGRPLRKLCPVHARRLVGIDLPGLLEALATPVPAGPAGLLARRLTSAGLPRAPLLTALGGAAPTLAALLEGTASTVLLRQELRLSALAAASGLLPTWMESAFDDLEGPWSDPPRAGEPVAA